MKHLRESRPTFEDWEGVHGVLSDAYFPHALRPRSFARGAAQSGVEAIDLDSCRLAHIRFGATVDIVSDHPGAMAVNIPLAGHLESKVGGHTSDVGPGRATAFPADTPARMPVWGPEVDLLGLRIDSGMLLRESERVFARQGVAVPLEIDLRSPSGTAWFQMARTTFDNARDDGGVLYRDPRMAESVGSTLVTGLLLAAVPEDPGPAGRMRPRTVHRVIAALEADPARAWSPADLAEIAGVSVRRLQQAFREHVGSPPLAYLQDVRLERVHDDLRHGRGSGVTDIALTWGFSHLGRFAGVYRQRFGCAPSETWARRD